MDEMKIAIVGTGYVGLVTGTCFAETGINVACVDIDKNKIEKLRQAIIPIYEPGLEPMVKRNLEKGRLHFTTSLAEAMTDAEVVFIAVGTPSDEDGSADLRYVLQVAREVGSLMTQHVVVVNKSTVPIGTAQKVKNVILEEQKKRGVNIPFDVASNPEFLKEGDAVEDFLRPDRIVVGVENEEAQKIMSRLYKPFLLNNHPIIFMDIASAELTKYAANAMLATKISFINDIANLCDIVGADVNMVRKGIGSDSRIGHKFIYAGIGYGGSCFPKDIKALIKTAQDNSYTLEILKAVDSVNNRQKNILFDKLSKHYGGDLKGKIIVLWGLAFKPNTDDMREAPALTLIDRLLKAGAHVRGYDPVAMDEARHRLGNSIEFAKDPYEALVDADALMVVTEWSEFRILKYKMLQKLMRNRVVLDGRNIFEISEMKENGFTYYGIGRPSVK